MLRPTPNLALFPGAGIISSSSSSRSQTPNPPKKELLPLEGPISPKYFSPDFWKSLIQTEFGRQQYAKFASLMVIRIRAGLSDFEEVQCMYDLILSYEELWKPVVTLIPELGIDSVHHPREPTMALLVDLIKDIMRDSKLFSFKKACNVEKQHCEKHLSTKQLRTISSMMLGEDDVPKSDRGWKMFDSTIEAGFPPAAFAAQNDKERIVYDLDDIPTNLFIHEPKRQPSPPFSETIVPMMLTDGCNTVLENESIFRHDQELKNRQDRPVSDDHHADEPPRELLMCEGDEQESESEDFIMSEDEIKDKEATERIIRLRMITRIRAKTKTRQLEASKTTAWPLNGIPNKNFIDKSPAPCPPPPVAKNKQRATSSSDEDEEIDDQEARARRIRQAKISKFRARTKAEQLLEYSEPLVWPPRSSGIPDDDDDKNKRIMATKWPVPPTQSDEKLPVLSSCSSSSSSSSSVDEDKKLNTWPFPRPRGEVSLSSSSSSASGAPYSGFLSFLNPPSPPPDIVVYPPSSEARGSAAIRGDEGFFEGGGAVWDGSLLFPGFGLEGLRGWGVEVLRGVSAGLGLGGEGGEDGRGEEGEGEERGGENEIDLRFWTEMGGFLL